MDNLRWVRHFVTLLSAGEQEGLRLFHTIPLDGLLFPLVASLLGKAPPVISAILLRRDPFPASRSPHNSHLRVDAGAGEEVVHDLGRNPLRLVLITINYEGL